MQLYKEKAHVTLCFAQNVPSYFSRLSKILVFGEEKHFWLSTGCMPRPISWQHWARRNRQKPHTGLLNQRKDMLRPSSIPDNHFDRHISYETSPQSETCISHLLVSDIIECQGSRGCPFVMLIVGASSLHHSLEKWDNIRKRLKGKVISKPVYNLHPNAKD